MDLQSEAIQRVLSKYKFHDVAVEELQKIHRIFPDMKPTTGTYTFSDNTQSHLLKLIGNLPVQYEGEVDRSDSHARPERSFLFFQGRTYNLPIQLWLTNSFPFTPPICLLRPTPDMVIREGKHVDNTGRIFLPGLHNWDHPKSSVVVLLKEMIAKFQEDPPLSTKAAQNSADPHQLQNLVSKMSVSDGGTRHHEQTLNKVSVVGGGDLGMASVMGILAKCKVDKLVFVDVAESSTKGGSTDLEIFSLPKVEVSRDMAASGGSRVIVLTANSWSSEQSYAAVVQANVDLYRGLVPNLVRLSPAAIFVVASHPVDIMTHVAWRQSGLPPTRVIGAGCNLDSERLSYILDINLNTHKQAWVIGELSDNKVPVMSNTGLNSSVKTEIAGRSSATKPLLDRAFDMMKSRGQRSWSVGLSIADITNSILTDQKKVHSISTLAQGWGGVGTEVFLSLPCVLGANGTTRLAGASLGPEEDSKLKDSISSLSGLMSQIQI